jgi:ATP-dependent Clp protease ATP-binding subunit ClpA
MESQALDTERLIETVAARSASSDPLLLLEGAVRFANLSGRATDAMVDHYVAMARESGQSWTLIGERLGISKQAARQRFAPRLEVTGEAVVEPAALAPRLVADLDAAQVAADADGSVPGTQHLLLGLLHVGVAASILDRLGVTRDKVREAAQRLLEPAGGDDRPRVVGDGEADEAVAHARKFAASRGQNLARTEHLLWVLAMDPGTSARRILDDLDVEVAQIKKQLNDYIPPARQQRRQVPRLGKRGREVGACSFCGCPDRSRAMVNGPGVRICADCVALATDSINATRDDVARVNRTGGGAKSAEQTSLSTRL